jgi:diacylglycerol kinase family enzyme
MGKMAAMRLALVANPDSGTGTDPGRIAALLAAGGADVSVYDIAGVEAAGRAAPDRIVVAGGDGAIGRAAAVAAAIDAPLAVVAAGTANDFARSLGLPLDIEGACALAASPEAGERLVDLARAGDVPFVNAAAAGLSVLAAGHARPLKARLGAAAYAVGALRAALGASPLRCRVACDGAVLFSGRAWQVIVAGTGAFGGGAEVEQADPGDGLLDVAVLEAGSRAGLVYRAWGMRRGGLVEQSGVHHARGRMVEVQGVDAFNVDGEIRELDPARFVTGERRVRVVVGEGSLSGSGRSRRGARRPRRAATGRAAG